MFLLMAAHPDPRAGRSYLHHILNKDNPPGLQFSREAIEHLRTVAFAHHSELQALYRSRPQATADEQGAVTSAHRAHILKELS